MRSSGHVPAMSGKSKRVPPKQWGKPTTSFGEAKANVKMPKASADKKHPKRGG